MNILVTGCGGFIGYHLCKKLILDKKNIIIGIDNINNYYSTKLKKNRIHNLKKKNFIFKKTDIKKINSLKKLFIKYKFDYVINLAAQAGVRYSITNPRNYLENNIGGFFNILELCKEFKTKHLVYASTSSVYGDSIQFPLSENLNTDKPLSFYAATKKCNEIMAFNYANLYKFQATGLRFFTVYGPYGRPDMALFKFVNSILNNKKIDLYNYGNHHRDFTYIDDVVDAIIKVTFKKRKEYHEVYNVGNGNPKSLKEYLSLIEKYLNIKAKTRKLKKQVGDVEKNHASLKKIKSFITYKPKTDIKDGVYNFIDWFKKYK